MDLKKLLFGGKSAAERTAQYAHSTQKWLPVADTRHGVIVTRDGHHIKVLEIMPVNFHLKSLTEQQNIIYYFGSYLKVAPDSLQIKVITQKADIEGYEKRMRAFYENEPSAHCRAMIEDNIREVRYLAANEAVTRRFFLVFRHEARMKTRARTAEAVAERLREEEQTARRYLELCGLSVRDVRYADNFNLELLYSLLNRRTGRNAKLPESAFDMVSKIAGVSDETLENDSEEGERDG